MEAIMNEHVTMKKIVHVFKNGRSRAVRIPKEFEFEGDEVEIEKNENGTLTLAPVRKEMTWAELFASLEPLKGDDRFEEIEDFAPEPVEMNWGDEE
jgi:antitoxin VapB